MTFFSTVPKKISQSYCSEYDMLSIRWEEEKTDYSEEITTDRGHKFVIDYSKDGKIIAIEIFDYEKGVDEK